MSKHKHQSIFDSMEGQTVEEIQSDKPRTPRQLQQKQLRGTANVLSAIINDQCDLKDIPEVIGQTMLNLCEQLNYEDGNKLLANLIAELEHCEERGN